jgi:hypothetical protein
MDAENPPHTPEVNAAEGVDAKPITHELILDFKSAGRNGKGALAAKVGDQTIFVNKLDITNEAERSQVVEALTRDFPGVDAFDMDQKLRDLAGKQVTEAGRRPRAKPPEAPSPEEQYRVEGGCLCRVTSMPFCAPIPTPLCNFDARITEEVVHDDGVEQSRRLTISGTLAAGEPLSPVEVGMEEFARGDWPLARWGSHAVVCAGLGNKDHLRAALQLLSGQVVRRTVYTYTGWCRIDEAWAYLHAGGAIGPEGPLDSVSVVLPDALASFRLPEPPSGESLVAAVRASLDLAQDLAPDKVILPLLMTVYRAVLPGADFSTHVCGRTGSFKTELAALLQQHFGAELHAKNLPASWSSTGNSLEVIAFSAKDALLVVDDFAPAGNATDINRYHREAERLFRAQGNRSGRQRLRPDGSLKPAKPPRGSVLSTGEDVPKGHSLRARLLVVEVERDDVDVARLTRCQQRAAAGLYAQAMAGYLRWLAVRYDRVRDELKSEVERRRGEITDLLGEGQHRRTPTLVADLLAGFDPFLQFAQEFGALLPEEAENLRRRCRAALLGVAAEQAALQEASDPCLRYFTLLASALSSGRAHVATPLGDCPGEAPQPWGWRSQEGEASPCGEWLPQGKCIGWLAAENLYLDPDAAYAEAQRLASEQGEPLTVGQGTLHKRLHEQHLLASVDSRPGHLKVRRMIAGSRRYVLHLHARQVLGGDSGGPSHPEEHGRSGQLLYPAESGPTGPIGTGGENGWENKPFSWTGTGPAPGPTPEKVAQNPLSWAGFGPAPPNRPTETAQNPRENKPLGPVGPVGSPLERYKTPPGKNHNEGQGDPGTQGVSPDAETIPRKANREVGEL